MGFVIQLSVEKGGFCCSVIGKQVNLVPKPAPTELSVGKGGFCCSVIGK